MLVNVSSIRLIVGFALSFNATTWIQDIGFLPSFSIYAGVLAVASLGLPLVYIYGKRLRSWTAGQGSTDSDCHKLEAERPIVVGMAL